MADHTEQPQRARDVKSYSRRGEWHGFDKRRLPRAVSRKTSRLRKRLTIVWAQRERASPFNGVSSQLFVPLSLSFSLFLFLSLSSVLLLFSVEKFNILPLTKTSARSPSHSRADTNVAPRSLHARTELLALPLPPALSGSVRRSPDLCKKHGHMKWDWFSATQYQAAKYIQTRGFNDSPQRSEKRSSATIPGTVQHSQEEHGGLGTLHRPLSEPKQAPKYEECARFSRRAPEFAVFPRVRVCRQNSAREPQHRH